MTNSEVNVPPRPRHRRLVAVPQAAIARAIRAAEFVSPAWRVAIESNVIHLFRGEPPVAKDAAPEHVFSRGLQVIP